MSNKHGSKCGKHTYMLDKLLQVLAMPRQRRSTVDLSTEREIDCVMGATGAYWKYDYEIPEKCYSE